VGALEPAYGLVAIELVLVAGLLGLVVAVARASPKRPPGASRTTAPTLPPAPAAGALAAVFDQCDPLGRGGLDDSALGVALKHARPRVRPDPATALMAHATSSGNRSGQLPRPPVERVALALLQPHGRRRAGVGERTRSLWPARERHTLRHPTLGKSKCTTPRTSASTSVHANSRLAAVGFVVLALASASNTNATCPVSVWNVPSSAP
jgi:hypothetical protein